VIPLLYEEGKITIRKLQEKDKVYLVKWLSTPAVLEFYEGRDKPYDLQMVEYDFYQRENDVEKCMVEYEGERIGYIQFYKVNEHTSEIKDFRGKGITYGIDQFIGETAYWNKGIGTLLVSSMVQYLVQVMKADRVIMDPKTTNLRALRCYEKCGFEKVRILPKHEFHEGEYHDCWLIEYVK